MMIFKELVMSRFRSWEHVSFKFQEGLTVLCGPNGAGKSSIRLGAQYAISGNVSRLKKDQLYKYTSKKSKTGSFYVKLFLETEDKKPLLIHRDTKKSMVSVDGIDMSVREKTYLSKLKTALIHTFLSPDQAAFVDIQDFKRKEMLYELIPEVEMLRTVCVPKIKEISKHVYVKKNNINQNIYTVKAVIEEQLRAKEMAQRTYDKEIERIEQLKKSIEQEIPYTEEEIRLIKDRLSEIKRDVKAYNTFIADGQSWHEKAVYTNSQYSAVINKYNQVKSELDAFRSKIATLEEMSDEKEEAILCTHCKKKLVCKSCGKAVVNTLPTNVSNKLVEYKSAEKTLCGTLDVYSKQMEVCQIVDSEQIAKIHEELLKARRNVSLLGNEEIELNGKLRQQQIAVNNIEAVKKAKIDLGTAEAIKAQIEEISERIKQAQEKVVRKQKVVEIMEKLEARLFRATEAMNTTLPSIFFDDFLTRLTTYCNYLLTAISDLSMQLSASDNGISIKVNDMEFEQLSSGEKQRVRTATTLAFSLLSRQSDTLFIDEVFDAYMDAEGIEVLAQLLSTTMRQFYKKIIVVSHQPYLATALNPDHIMMVSTDLDGDSQVEKLIHANPQVA
jgi:DNA repair exonuclease SbcCD ATPase subunit